jgi:sec-independent protein translocase protein TatA
MFNIGPLELMLILLIALVVVGPARLPEVGRSIGKGLREFRKVQDEVRDSINFNLDEPIRPPSPRKPYVRTPQPPAPTPEDEDPGPAPAPAAGPENEAAAIASEETPATTEASPAGHDASADSVDPATPADGSTNGSTPAPETPRE